ncbi:MAG: T9SS type A sorting domain-containing protein [Prevotella sp.]
MRKKLLSMAVALCAAFVPTAAQNGYGIFDYSEQMWVADDGESYFLNGPFVKVSANGRYAVGYDFQNYTGCAFFFDAQDNEELFLMNDASNRIYLNDVTNDGLMVGGFEKREYAETKSLMKPGYRTLYEDWKALPVPENYSTYYNTDDPYALSGAVAVTPDGEYIAGQICLTRGFKNTFLGLLESSVTAPCVWKKSGNEYVIDKVYDDIYKNSMMFDGNTGEWKEVADSISFQYFVVYDITDDGKTVVGVNTAGSGGQNPAFIRDGKLWQLFNCGEVDDDYKNFNGGIVKCVDTQGNMYGYYQLEDASVKYFKYTTDNKLVYVDIMVTAVTDDGTLVGNSESGIQTVLDASADGSVKVGGTMHITDAGVYYTPCLAMKTGGTDGISLSERVDSSVKVDYRKGGALFVNGEYSSACIYDAAGKRVAQGGQGKSFSLAGMPSGVYVVKVNTAHGTQSFKVAR